MNPLVSFHLVTHNGERYLPDLFASLRNQTWSDFTLRMIDNASDDGTQELMRGMLGATAIHNTRNLGFSPAHNQAMRLAFDKCKEVDPMHAYVIVANQDLVLAPECVAKLVEAMEAYPEAGSAQGKILRAYIEHPNDDYLAETICADRIDSTGLRAHRNRRFTDRGAGEMDEGQYDVAEEIFGATGALAIYRVSALLSVQYEDEVFDRDFFMYKEDVDLAWRLQSAGWTSRYVPESVAYHHRGLFGRERPTIRERIQARREKPRRLSMFSTRNQYLTLLKNETFFGFLFSSPFLLWSEGKQLLYSLMAEPHVIKGLLQGFRLIPRMWKKRRFIKRARVVRPRMVRRWFYA